VVQQAIEAGYNTNYVQSWWGARAHIRTNKGQSDPNKLYTRGNLKDQSGGQAGVAVRFIEKSFVSTSAVAMLGDAGPGDINEAVLSDDVGTELKKGSRLCESFNDGPSFINASTVTQGVAPPIQILSAYTTEGITSATFGCPPSTFPTNPGTVKDAFGDDILPLPDEETYGGVDISRNNIPGDGVTDQNQHGIVGGYGGSDGTLILQDTRDFSAIHGSGANKACNILFADTNVKTIYDSNGDSYINPGFPVTMTAQPNAEERAILAATTGYTNNKCESAPAEFYNGPVLDNSIITKTVFETN